MDEKWQTNPRQDFLDSWREETIEGKFAGRCDEEDTMVTAVREWEAEQAAKQAREAKNAPAKEPEREM